MRSKNLEYMEPKKKNVIVSQKMKPETFDRFSEFIQNELGIKMGRNKQVMLQARLVKRLRKLGIATYEEYYDYLFSADGHQKELPFFLHQVTTNKTDFFREPAHFTYLTGHALPALINDNTYNSIRPLRVWSSACATGEEPYTLAMVLSDFSESKAAMEFSILATDISPTVLQQAAEGIFEESKIEPVPLSMRKKYLLRSKDKTRKQVRVVPELRSKIRFQWLNLKSQPYHINSKMDIIFCRNVLIYFSQSTQEAVLSHMCTHLVSGGYIFMGHSETLSGFDLPLRQVTTTVYRKT